MLSACSINNESPPSDFVFITDVDPSIIESVRYVTDQNFLGKKVDGYDLPKIVMTKAAALRLKDINAELKEHGYTLVVYDAYRPQRAVDHFIRWADDADDEIAKPLYYPTLGKHDLFNGYLAKKSGHSRGSTVDISIIETGKKLMPIKISKRQLKNGEEIPFLDDGTIDMGASFDLLHEASHHDSELISKERLEWRNFLRSIMKKHGFKEYWREWWHYTLENEPYPDRYFDFVAGDCRKVTNKR
jgi:D-alanyl-D-alanine dipeptidase